MVKSVKIHQEFNSACFIEQTRLFFYSHSKNTKFQIQRLSGSNSSLWRLEISETFGRYEEQIKTDQGGPSGG